MKKQETKIVTYWGAKGFEDFPDSETTLVQMIEWLQGKLNELPEEYRETARCSIDSQSEYGDDHCAAIEISYLRMETDEEAAERTQEAANRADEEEAILLKRLAEIRNRK